MRQPSLRVLIASILLSLVSSDVIALLMAVIPAPSCCWLVSTFLSRNLIISIIAAEISMFSFGACSNVQLPGTRYCFKNFSLFSLVIPFISSGFHSWVKLLCMSSPHVGPWSVASPRAERMSGSNGGKLESTTACSDSIGAGGADADGAGAGTDAGGRLHGWLALGSNVASSPGSSGSFDNTVSTGSSCGSFWSQKPVSSPTEKNITSLNVIS